MTMAGMKPLALAACCLLAMGAARAGDAPPPTVTGATPEKTTPVAEARHIAGELGTRLKTALQAAMQSGGAENAIAVCHDMAIPVTAAVGDESGWEVGRTSLRIRNPDNAPDAWERSVLENFAQRLTAGEDIATLEQEAVITVGNFRYFRYMKAIPAGEPCMACHGTTIAPPLAARLQALYPDDRATGFAPGDLRGAFSLTRKLD